MRRDRRLLVWTAAGAGAAAVLLLGVGGGSGLLVWSTLDAAERGTLAELLGPRAPLLLMVAAAGIGAAAAAAAACYRRWLAPPARLLEQAGVLLATDAEVALEAPGAGADVQGLAQLLNALAAQRDALRREMEAEVARASRGVAEERNRLAALMSELTQSVVVCNLDGRILLYNNRARVQFRALSDAPALADGAEMIGLGRSIYTVFDRHLIAHALESVQQRVRRGAPNPSAQFVTATRSGQLLRAQMAPVRGVSGVGGEGGDAAEGEGGAPITGFVLMLDNITAEYEAEGARVQLLHGLTEGSRGSLANLRAAAEMLDDADLDAAMRTRFLAVVREEARVMSERLHDVARENAQGLATRWPLEEIRGIDFVLAVQRRIEALTGIQPGIDSVDAALWLKLDSYSMLQALAYLALRLRDELDIRTLALRLSAASDTPRGRLDLVWAGRPMSTETVLAWEIDPIAGAGGSTALTVRDVVQRHGGAFWFERERVRHEAFFRFLLPLAPAMGAAEGRDAAAAHVRGESRPEFYDFDLFAASEASRALDDRRLTELSYTVFDTETTGLNPSGGDAIIQIGAARLVNGRLLRNECFEQLVDPERPIPAASIPIHGITPDMVRGKPKLAAVLPAFHAYAHDTVLVAHNAAFDMRFLQLQEAATGLRFDQPVLDTLLLSAVVHPNQNSHRLEAIAERLGVDVVGRHTALGDALVTAEVFQKLLALLAERGIETLGQARAAAERTYYARLRY